jgi:hypothetical protein
MTKSQILYEEKGELYLRFSRAPEILDYETRIIIKDKGKKPVTVELEFSGIEPLAAPMPPHHHKIVGESVTDLFAKMYRWARKYGYSVC